MELMTQDLSLVKQPSVLRLHMHLLTPQCCHIHSMALFTQQYQHILLQMDILLLQDRLLQRVWVFHLKKLIDWSQLTATFHRRKRSLLHSAMCAPARLQFNTTMSADIIVLHRSLFCRLKKSYKFSRKTSASSGKLSVTKKHLWTW